MAVTEPPKPKRARQPVPKGADQTAPKSARQTAPKGTGDTAPKAADGGRVAVVGAGLAGLTAALRLTQVGFQVTLFEACPELGGNLSSQQVNGVEHDVYPHMFCQWYDNFWHLFEHDLGFSRDEHFASRPGVMILDRGTGKYHQMLNATSIKAVIDNLRSGTMSAPEMFLLGFSMLDLAAHPFNRSGLDQLDKLDVNGFIYSRGYATEPVAKMENYTLMLVWSIQSERTAAVSYQDFIKHTLTYPDHSPFAWMLKGSLAVRIIAPLEAKLRALGCEIRHSTRVESLRLVDGLPVLRSLSCNGVTDTPPASEAEGETFDQIVLAVPPEQLVDLAMFGDNDLPGDRLVDKRPALSELRRLVRVPIPVVDIYFKRKLEGIPKDHIGLGGSRFDLTLLDISQLWTGPEFADHSVLVVAASDADALSSADPLKQGFMMIVELNAYVTQFNPGKYWGDPDSDIDWDKTHFRPNDRHPLFVNDVGSWEWRPMAAYPQTLPRVYFAGDFCKTDVDMATVESAVQSGIAAAQALQYEDALAHDGKRRGAQIEMTPHTVYSTSSLRAAKLLLLPLAYGAVFWAARDQRQRMEDSGATNIGQNQYTLSEYSLVLPMQFALDWWKSAYWLGRSFIPGDNATGMPSSVLNGPTFTNETDFDEAVSPVGRPDDNAIGPVEAALLIAEDALRTIAAALEKRDKKDLAGLAAGAGAALGGLSDIAEKAMKAMQSARAASQAATSPADPGPYKRRWRVKR
nr:FAD-dependent oxidoreductase [Polymorphobacter sp.]